MTPDRVIARLTDLPALADRQAAGGNHRDRD